MDWKANGSMMKTQLSVIIAALSAFFFWSHQSWAQTTPHPDLVVIGNIPGEYVGTKDVVRPEKDKTYLGYIHIRNRLIVELKVLAAKTYLPFLETMKKNGTKLIVLHADVDTVGVVPFKDLQRDADVIYPGLINLHNHTKQNNLPVWKNAQGQFVNRFEWKDFIPYKKAVSFNVNPWVNYGPAAECATYRWSEMQAMVGGTAYLQGPSSCVSGFGIARVEDTAAYISQKERVSAPTDLIIPEEFSAVWSELRPLILGGKTYEQALVQTIHKYCPSLKTSITEKNINTEALKILADKSVLKMACQTEYTVSPSFLRYISESTNHAAIAGRKKYLSNPKRSAIIVHLAEGREDDAYNKIEYEMFDLLGFTRPLLMSAKRQVPMVFVHGVGVPKEKFSELAKKGIGLVWSPFSNLLLYDQTLDVVSAQKAGVVLSLGSDWLPTGSRHVLEELKFAKQYLKKQNLFQVPNGFTDETLYKMVTENPAKQIDHYDLKLENARVIEAPVGRLLVGAMGSVIAVKKTTDNPYTNLVDATEREINLNVIDGKPVYGNKSYIDQYAQIEYEELTVDSLEYSLFKEQNTPKPAMEPPFLQRVTRDATQLQAHLVTLGKYVKDKKFTALKTCQFDEAKVFVQQNSLDSVEEQEQYQEIVRFRTETGLNLDRASDIAKILAVNILTQSRNMLEPDGDPEFALKNFNPLYSCNDGNHQAKLKYYFEQATPKPDRIRLRDEQKLGGTLQLYDLYK